jgi:hypothetical protein
MSDKSDDRKVVTVCSIYQIRVNESQQFRFLAQGYGMQVVSGAKHRFARQNRTHLRDLPWPPLCQGAELRHLGLHPLLDITITALHLNSKGHARWHRVSRVLCTCTGF